MKEPVTLWDIGIRGFHWLLVLSVGLMWLTGDVLDAFDWHEKFGLLVAGLLTFRVVWGVMGSSTARFNQFFPSKASIADYLNGRWQGVGHNPLGAVSVFALLITLLLMVMTGLFASNDGDYTGPLAFLVSTSVSEVLTNVHGALFNVLVLLVCQVSTD